MEVYIWVIEEYWKIKWKLLVTIEGHIGIIGCILGLHEDNGKKMKAITF